MKKTGILFLLIALSSIMYGQGYDTLASWQGKDSIVMQGYKTSRGTFYYPRPRPFSFVTQIPRTFVGAAKNSFRRESLDEWITLAATTAILIVIDQEFLEGVQRGSHFIGLDNERVYHEVLKFRLGKQEFDVWEAPGNLNTAIYSIGEGIPPLLLSAGMWGFGLAKKDYRALSTASQIVQATTAAGLMTQFIKRTTGRESPHRATAPGGVWRPFPAPKTYQQNVPTYDAFPSGHMGTMVATYVVLRENYPDKKWIKPVGLTLISLVGLSMVNNSVHWASDYPMAIGLGYVFAKATVNLNRVVRGEVPVKGMFRKAARGKP